MPAQIEHIDALKHKAAKLHAWYLNAANYRKIWVSGNGMLWPTAMTLFAFVLIQNVGQLHSLASALAASIRGHSEYYDGGYAASIGDLLIWWVSCWFVVLAGATYGAEKPNVNAAEITTRYRWGGRQPHGLHLIEFACAVASVCRWTRCMAL